MKNELKRLLEQTLTMSELLDKINQIDPLHDYKIWDYIINENEFLDLIKTQSLKQILKTIANINRQEAKDKYFFKDKDNEYYGVDFKENKIRNILENEE